MSWELWLPAMLFAAVGVATAGGALWTARRRDETDRRVFSEIDGRDAASQREALVAELDDLDMDAFRLDPAGHRSERGRVLQGLQLMPVAGASGSPPPPPPLTDDDLVARVLHAFIHHPQRRGFAAGALCTLLVGTGLLALFHVQANEPARPGRVPHPAEIPVSADPLLGALWQRFHDDPSHVGTTFRLAHRLLMHDRWDEAAWVNDHGLSLDEQNVEGRVHRAVLVGLGGDMRSAMAQLLPLCSGPAQSAEAWLYRGYFEMRLGEVHRARDSWKQFVRLAPPGPERDMVSGLLPSATRTP